MPSSSAACLRAPVSDAVQLATNGTGTSGLGNLDLGGAQTVNVTGTGWRLASANTQPATINFGNVLVNSSQAQFLNIQNTALGDGFSERLDARFLAGGTTGDATNNGGSISLLAAGASNAASMSVGVNTATIGAKTGQVIVAFDSNGSATSGLGVSGLPNQGISILADVLVNVGTLAQPSAITPNPVNFGNFRVGAPGAGPQNLSISNLATVGEGLNASIATASAGFAATGSFISLAPTTTNNSSLQVSFNDTATAGAKSGTATVTLVSDGTFNGGTTTALPSQTVTMNAAVYNQAVGVTTPGLITITNQRMGGSLSQVLTVANTAAVGSFSEDLRASFGSNTGAASNNGGSISALLAGANNASAMSVGVDTSTAGARAGSVTLNYQTTGTVNSVSNGLGLSSANAPQVINVSGNVYQAASGALQTGALNFGTVQVGQTINQNLVVRNTATGAAGFVEDLNASFGASGNIQITGAGSLSGNTAGNNSTAGNGTMTVTVQAATAGALNSSIGVNYFSAGAVGGVSNSLGTLAVGSENYGVSGIITAVVNVINQANALVNNPTINLGAVRVGAAAPSAAVSVTNVASAPPQAALNAAFASTSGPITASGSFNLLNPGATNASSLVVGLNTGTAGNFTGGNAGTATINFVSDANNVGNCAPNCQLNLASQVVNVEGKVYTQAVGSASGTAINFGVVRVGDTVSASNITISNTAASTALNDTLRADLTGVSGPFSAPGSVAGVAPQSTAQLAMSLNTATAGVFSQIGTLGFLSQNADMADVSAGANASVSVFAQVNNLANGDFDLLSGGGTLSQSGTNYVLDLGTLVLGSSVASLLQMDNEVSGPADELSGLFDLAAADDFGYGGWNPLAFLVAGDAGGAMSVNWLAGALGSYTDTIVFNGRGTNASDSIGLAQTRRLTIRATVVDGGGTVPEPGTLSLLLGAAAAAGLARRRAFAQGRVQAAAR